MAITTSQAQGLVLALFGASAGGHLTGLAAASDMNTLAGDLSMSAGLILGKDLSSNTAFRDHITSNLKLTGDALTAANAWLDGQLNAGAARGDMVATAVTFLATLTDTTSPFYAAAQTFNTTVSDAVTWSTGAGATTFGVSALRANQGNVEVVAGSSFVLTTGTDAILGTAGNDVISGTSATLATTDAIFGGEGSDTLNLTLTAVNATANMSGIEAINVNWNAFGTATVDAANITGATITGTSTKTGFLGNFTVNNAKENSVVAGAGMKGTLTVGGATNITVDGSAAKAIAVTSSGVVADDVAASVTAGEATTSVDVRGFQATTIDAKAAKTIRVDDADTAVTTDGYTATVKSSGTAVSLTTGVDTLNYEVSSTQTLTLSDAVEKVLAITGAGAVTIKTDDAYIDGKTVSGAKSIVVTTQATDGGANSVDFSKVTADTIELSAGVGDTVVFANGANVLLSADGGASTDLTVKSAAAGKADSISVTATAAQTALAFTSVETVNIAVDVAAVTGFDINLATVNAGTNTVVLTGANDVQFGTALTAKALDASGLTGDLSVVSTQTAGLKITGNTGKLTVDSGVTTATLEVNTSGAFDDSITSDGTAGAAVLNLADGRNTVTAAVVGGTLTVTTGTGVDTVKANDLAGGTVDLSLGDGNNVIEVELDNQVSAAAVADNVSIVSGAGNDSFKTTGTDHASDVLTLDLGTGTNTLTLVDSKSLQEGTITLTGVSTLQLGATAGTVNAKNINGASFTVKGAATTPGTLTTDFIVVSTATAASTINLSSLTIDKSLTKGIEVVEVQGSAYADTITGTAEVDTIKSGEGADVINGGKGADVIYLGAIATLTDAETTAKRDTVVSGNVADGVDSMYKFDHGAATTDDVIDFTAVSVQVAKAQADLVIDIAGATNVASYAVGANGLVILYSTNTATGTTEIMAAAADVALVAQALAAVLTDKTFAFKVDAGGGTTQDGTAIVSETSEGLVLEAAYLVDAVLVGVSTTGLTNTALVA